MEFAEFFDQVNDGILVKLGFSLLAILGTVVLRYLVLKIVYNRIEDIHDQYFWRNWTKYVAAAISIIILGFIWIDRIGSLATFIGLVGAGLTIALREPLVNIAGWLFIVTRQPFKVGDRIEIDNHAGDVVDIRIFQFTINEIGNWVDADQSTGRIIHIPNGLIFTKTQVNYTAGFSHIWNEIGVQVTFESDWKKAKEILLNVIEETESDPTDEAKQSLKKTAKKYLIFYQKLDPIVYTSVKDSGVMLTLRYLVKPQRRRGSANRIWESILEKFKEHPNIEFAYPTQRVYFEPQEGNQNKNQEIGFRKPDKSNG